MNYINLIPVQPESTEGAMGNNGSFTIPSDDGNFVITNNTAQQLLTSAGFNGNNTTYLRTGVGGNIGGYINIKFPKKEVIGKYKLELSGSALYNMKRWTITALVDNEWITIHEGVNNVTGTDVTVEFEFDEVRTDTIRIKCEEKIGTNSWGFINFYVYKIDIITKGLLLDESTNKYYTIVNDSLQEINVTTIDNQLFIDNGFIISEDYQIPPIINSNYDLLVYTNYNNSPLLLSNSEEYHIYDYLSTTIEVQLDNDRTSDIVISTKTIPSIVSELFTDDVEMYYTSIDSDNINITTTDEHSFVDSVSDENILVVTTSNTDSIDEVDVEFNYTPVPLFIQSTLISEIGLFDFSSKNYNDHVRLLFTTDKATWYKWNGYTFQQITLTNDVVVDYQNANTQIDLYNLTIDDIKSVFSESLYLGIFIVPTKNDINTISFDLLASSNRNISTPSISQVSMYILNTTATINVQLEDNKLIGQVNDADLTRVQYRVIINESAFYPSNGEFTELSSPPQNIDLTIPSTAIRIGESNNIRVEFRDTFGTVDYWEADFIGRYYGLMFKSDDGHYYSTDIGEVLRYLDFGQVIQGNYSETKSIIISNENTVPVTNVEVTVPTSSLPNGLSVEIKSQNQESWVTRTILSENLNVGESVTMDIRMKSDNDTIPTGDGQFRIFASANKEE